MRFARVLAPLSGLMAALACAACGGEPPPETGTVRFQFDRSRLSELSLGSLKIHVIDGSSTVSCESIMERPAEVLPTLPIAQDLAIDVPPFTEDLSQEILDLPVGSVTIAIEGYEGTQASPGALLAIGCNVGTIEAGKKVVIPVRLFALG